MQTFTQDAFTRNIVHCYTVLVTDNILNKKKVYTDTIDVYLSSFNQMEKGIRNYPSDEAKRSAAVDALKVKWNINPELFFSQSSKVYLKKTKPALESNSSYENTFEELQTLRNRCKQLEDENAELKRQLGLKG